MQKQSHFNPPRRGERFCRPIRSLRQPSIRSEPSSGLITLSPSRHRRTMVSQNEDPTRRQTTRILNLIRRRRQRTASRPNYNVANHSLISQSDKMVDQSNLVAYQKHCRLLLIHVCISPSKHAVHNETTTRATNGNWITLARLCDLLTEGPTKTKTQNITAADKGPHQTDETGFDRPKNGGIDCEP